jgi:hypothetical protein
MEVQDERHEGTTMTKDRLTSAQQFAVMKLIEANGDKQGEYWIYHSGWDDERVSREAGNANLFGVARCRKQVFGLLRKGPSTYDDTFETIESELRQRRVAQYQIEKRVESLEKALNVLLSTHTVPKDKLEQLREHFSGMVTVTPQLNSTDNTP